MSLKDILREMFIPRNRWIPNKNYDDTRCSSLYRPYDPNFEKMQIEGSAAFEWIRDNI